MLNKTKLPLTDYQRAILTQIGVTNWHLQSSVENKQALQDSSVTQASSTTAAENITANHTSVNSSQNALEALKQLKQEVLAAESVDQVLLNLAEGMQSSPLVDDVLLAMQLASIPTKQVSAEQLKQFKDYPLSWTADPENNTITLKGNQLNTGSLAQLSSVASKKQLWLLIQQNPIAHK